MSLPSACIPDRLIDFYFRFGSSTAVGGAAYARPHVTSSIHEQTRPLIIRDGDSDFRHVVSFAHILDLVAPVSTFLTGSFIASSPRPSNR
jgi:hypothetical protein